MSDFLDTHQRIVAKYRAKRPEIIPADIPEVASTDVHEVEKAFVMTSDVGHTVITAPIRQRASANQHFMYLQGRFVQADAANDNGAYWSTADLQLGQPTVVGGPLNWLHQERRIVGALIDSELVTTEKASVGNHISSTAVVWKFLFPDQAAIIEKASADKDLYYSMECVSREVQCVSDGGCGESFPYVTFMREKSQVCEHLRAGQTRRLVDPIFLGGAIIVPPVRPGWQNASAEVVRHAASVAEDADLPLSSDAANDMVQQILCWANGQ